MVSVVKLSVVMLNVVMLAVIMLSIDRLSLAVHILTIIQCNCQYLTLSVQT
jgi:hypothetical protein